MTQEPDGVRIPARQIAAFMILVGVVTLLSPLAVLLGWITLAYGNLLITVAGLVGIIYFGFLSPNRNQVPPRVLLTFGLYSLIPALHYTGLTTDYSIQVLYSLGLMTISVLIVLRWWVVATEIGDKPQYMIGELMKSIKLALFRFINLK